MAEDYFPQGVAIGAAFLGREKESEILKKNIRSGHHTLLLAPRRYGKTSLAMHVMQELQLPYEEVNCYLAISATAIEKKFLTAVQNLLKNLLGNPEKILVAAQSYFKKSQKRWTLGFKGVLGFEITPEKQGDYSENILTALQLIEDILSKQNQQAIIFIDEIQEIESLEENRQIEATIRQFAQYAKNLVFIFSGSNRRILQHMFDNKAMPLYELCERIILERIAAKYYREYLDKVSLKTFKTKMADDAFDKIIAVTECHPKRIYNLCYILWQQLENSGKIPDANAVINAWETYLQQRLRDTQYHLSLLSRGQLKLLTLIASGFSDEPTGQIAQKKVKLSGASIVTALQVLVTKDYIEKKPDGKYHLIDPLFRDILVKYEMVNLDLY